MRTKITIQALLIVFLFPLWLACSDNMGTSDNRLAEVTSLIEPMNAKEVVLETSVTASLYFEWDYVDTKEAGVATYRIAFDTEDGDFSSPVHVMMAENNGLANHITVSHRDLNKIAGKAGFNPSATGTIKWTILSSKGTKTMKSPQEHKLVITRLGGFEEIPIELFIAGEATEEGADIANAIAMKNLAEGEFEIYTHLTAGQPFRFVSGKSDESTEYSLTNDNIVIGGTSEVPVTGVYKFYLNFDIGSFTMKYIAGVALFVNRPQKYIELPYIGSGIWGVTNYEVTGLTGDDNTDDRYKFRMTGIENMETMEEIITEWRAPNNDSKPSGNPEYYYMVEKTDVAQWTDGQIWKIPATDGWSGKRYDISFSLNPDEPYTHNLVIK